MINHITSGLRILTGDIYSLIVFMLPCILYFVFQKKRFRQLNIKKSYLVWVFLFLYYCYLAIVKVAGVGTIWDLIVYDRANNNINLTPFASVGYRTYVLNIFLFVPIGILLPFIWKENRKFFKTVLIGFGISLLIEVMQLFNVRVTDIDDLIMNTIGTALGYGIWALLDILFLKGKPGYQGIRKNEGVLLILLGSVAIFLLYNLSFAVALLEKLQLQ